MYLCTEVQKLLVQVSIATFSFRSSYEVNSVTGCYFGAHCCASYLQKVNSINLKLFLVRSIYNILAKVMFLGLMLCVGLFVLKVFIAAPKPSPFRMLVHRLLTSMVTRVQCSAIGPKSLRSLRKCVVSFKASSCPLRLAITHSINILLTQT